jgi:aspartate aminotransferase
MAVDVRFDGADLARVGPNPFSLGMEGSDILAIAAQINARKAAGAPIANFTIGDFDPKLFPIPAALGQAVAEELAAGQTNYPPAVGLPELRSAISSFYAEHLGFSWPASSILVGSGARPPIYAAFQTVVAPGDTILFPTPTWNCRYYVYLSQAKGVAVPTRPENGFMPTVRDLAPHLGEARVLYLNSPLNPCGTVIEPALLQEICEAIVEENRRRQATSRRPLILIYDMVYWQLVFAGARHVTPIGLVPEMAPYTILVDAISKWWAATGLRVGWAAVPPWAFGPMQSLIGHVGAWAGRAEQRAVARLLSEPARTAPFVDAMNATLHGRLDRLYDGLRALGVEAVPARGAIYLSVRFDRGSSDEELRTWLLDEAGIGVVPFTAFGYPAGTGWVRFSVGAASDADIDAALGRLRAALAR